jgi:hypothetical protein
MLTILIDEAATSRPHLCFANIVDVTARAMDLMPAVLLRKESPAQAGLSELANQSAISLMIKELGAF